MIWSYCHHGWGWVGWVVKTMMMLVFWAAHVYGGIAVWRALGRDRAVRVQPGADARTEAERVSDERFTRGGIDEDDYARGRAVLRSKRWPVTARSTQMHEPAPSSG